jgi:hypothetical protein
MVRFAMVRKKKTLYSLDVLQALLAWGLTLKLERNFASYVQLVG